MGDSTAWVGGDLLCLSESKFSILFINSDRNRIPRRYINGYLLILISSILTFEFERIKFDYEQHHYLKLDAMLYSPSLI